MAISKDQMIGFRLLNQCFTSKKKEWTRKELEENMIEHGIKSIQKDADQRIDLMKNDGPRAYNAPIGKTYKALIIF